VGSEVAGRFRRLTSTLHPEHVAMKIRIDYVITAALLFSMAAIAFINVLSRYFLHLSFAATEEITINLFVWMTVLGTGIAFERSGHLGMIAFYRHFPVAVKKSVLLVSAALNALLFILVNVYMIQAIYDEITLFKANSAALGIPVWIYYAGVPLLSVTVFRGVYRNTAEHLRRLEGNA
jgi:TRAP-type C4-dicarboxylate transport system permease small subunit